MPKVIVQKWEESERGWGIRPDGYSIHKDREALHRYVLNYWNGMPDRAPDTYSRPSGTPFEAEVDDMTFTAMQKTKDGLMFYDNNYPGSGGKDGWVNAP
jgi:hypothetical protein